MRKYVTVATIALAAIVVFAFRLCLLIIGSALYVYLLPGVIADKRNHPRQREIYLVCALAGWLVVPWLLALWVANRATGAAGLYVDAPLAVHGFED